MSKLSRRNQRSLQLQCGVLHITNMAARAFRCLQPAPVWLSSPPKMLHQLAVWRQQQKQQEAVGGTHQGHPPSMQGMQPTSLKHHGILLFKSYTSMCRLVRHPRTYCTVKIQHRWPSPHPKALGFPGPNHLHKLAIPYQQIQPAVGWRRSHRQGFLRTTPSGPQTESARLQKQIIPSWRCTKHYRWRVSCHMIRVRVLAAMRARLANLPCGKLRQMRARSASSSRRQKKKTPASRSRLTRQQKWRVISGSTHGASCASWSVRYRDHSAWKSS
mmetsp:Transcript_111687/g.222020  ORF Transcript_111687/g.222020 Transcript_111687/m.222020 type:complete len:272 (+) Transcript_111687:389-1204(+)